MADVFISYKREERQAVERLAQELRMLDLDVWFDASLNAGEAFSDEIDREARAAKAILVCWSPGARASDWVKAEALIGFTNKKLAACYAAGPDAFDPPAPFNSIHAEDLRAWLAAPSHTHAGWKSILRRVGRLCGREDIESYGALDVRVPASMLRAWLAHHEESPLFRVVDELLRVRDAEDGARILLEQETRERRAREEFERREREKTERLARELEDSRRRTEQEARAQREREAKSAAEPRVAETMAATAGLVALIILFVWQPWRSTSGLVAPAPSVELRSPSVAAPVNNFELTCSLLSNSTPTSLRTRYGAENLSAERVPVGEGQSYSATVLYSSDPIRRLEFVWDDTGALWQIRVLGSASAWVGPNGLRLGQTLQDIERANAAPFTLTGWGWDYGGRAYNWGAGALSREPCRILVQFDARAPAPMGDSDFASNSVAVRNAEPVVVGLILAPR